MKYAAETEVSSDRSQAEIKTTLQKYGATKYAYYEDEGKAAIGCEMRGRQLRFIVNLPDRQADEFIYRNLKNDKRCVRDIGEQHSIWEKACRHR